MYCSHCGQQIPDGSKFCPKCGQHPGVVPGAQPDGAAPHMQAQPGAQAAQPAAAKKVSNKTIGMIAAAVAAIVVILIVVKIGGAILGGGKTVDLNKYATVTFEGENGDGRAEFDFDTDQFVKDHKSLVGMTGEKMVKNLKQYLKNNKDFQKALEWYGVDVDAKDIDDELDELLGSIGSEKITEDDLEDVASLFAYCYELDPTYHLSNGDKVELSWNVENNLTEVYGAMLGLKVKGEDKTFKVKGLEK